MENKIDVNEKISELKQAFSDFKESISKSTKDLQINLSDWGLTINSHEDSLVVDFSLKIVIKHSQKGEIAKNE